jgi:S-adenosylmethionine synthetase
MADSSYVFTSESVTEGHPDKLCDRMSDAIVGRYLVHDPSSRVTAECAVSTGIVFVSLKLRTRAHVDVPLLVRDVIRRTGYPSSELDARTCTVMTSINELSGPGTPRVQERLDDEAVETMIAENQATLFGFACTHTPALMPLPIWLAHKIARRIALAQKNSLHYLSPDGKTQVAVELREGKPVRIFGLTIIAPPSGKNAPKNARLCQDIREHIVEPVFADEALRPDEQTSIMINPEGSSNGGPAMHAGLTGRKTADDTYGAFARDSGAALSGKDPGRIDRIGAYAARWVAKNVVAARLAETCEVQLSYSIGSARPVSVHVDTYGTGKLHDEELGHRIEEVFDLRVGAIIKALRLRELPRAEHGEMFEKLAAYGHVGRTDLALPWESTNKTDALLGH